MNSERPRVCFLGGVRYGSPLDATSAKKFAALGEIAEMWVIGFSRRIRFEAFVQVARFHLIPHLPVPLARHVSMIVLGACCATWFILARGVRTIVAQSPYEGVAGAVAKVLARAVGIRVFLVVESHGDFAESLFLQRNVSAPGLHRRVMRVAALFSLRRADALRPVSDFTRSQLLEWVPGKPVIQFPAWTDMGAFFKAGETRSAERGAQVLYAGVVIPRKGIDVLLEAFRRVVRECPEARLRMVGDAEDRKYEVHLRNRMREHELGGRVDLLPAVNQAELARHMARAAVLAVPSRSEGLGRVAFEALACGTPVVASRTGGLPEIVRDGETGYLVPVGDAVVLAERLVRILKSPEEALEMGRRGREFARAFFSTRGFVNGYQELFALARGDGRGAALAEANE